MQARQRYKVEFKRRTVRAAYVRFRIPNLESMVVGQRMEGEQVRKRSLIPPSGTGWWSSACPPTRPSSPDRGPVSSLKAVELANLCGPTLAEVIAQAHRGIDRVRRTPHLAYSFLRRTGLSVS